MASCIFCGSVNASQEHVWPKWISSVLAEQGSFLLEAEQVGLRRWTQSTRQIEHITNRVCASCNNGWMSRLESDVKPILEPMLRGTPIQISLVDQPILARWILKTAMTLEQTGAGSRKKFFSPEEHLGIKTGRRMPKYLHVWIAHISDHSLAAWASEDDLTFRSDESSGKGSGTGYTSTLSAGAFAFQLVCLRPQSPLAIELEPEFSNEEGWHGCTSQLWPTSSACVWPPARSLDHELLKIFGARFTGGA